jgi:hypothetical protein
MTHSKSRKGNPNRGASARPLIIAIGVYERGVCSPACDMHGSGERGSAAPWLADEQHGVVGQGNLTCLLNDLRTR